MAGSSSGNISSFWTSTSKYDKPKVVEMVCWIFSFVRNLYRLYGPGSPIFWLSCGSSQWKISAGFPSMEGQKDVSFFSTLSPLGAEVLAVATTIGSYPPGPKVSIDCFPLLNNIAPVGSPLIQPQLWLSPGFSNCSLTFVPSDLELVTGSHCCWLLLFI